MFLKNTELKKYINTEDNGDKENPIVTRLFYDYKIAVYMGYSLKWDFSMDWVTAPYPEPYSQKPVYYLTPFFKKSYDRFDFWYSSGWDYIMGDLLVKMKGDGLINKKLEELILDLDCDLVYKECVKIINLIIKDYVNPFLNIKNIVKIQ